MLLLLARIERNSFALRSFVCVGVVDGVDSRYGCFGVRRDDDYDDDGVCVCVCAELLRTDFVLR